MSVSVNVDSRGEDGPSKGDGLVDWAGRRRPPTKGCLGHGCWRVP